MKKTTWLAAGLGMTIALASSCVGGDGIRLPDETNPDDPIPGTEGDPADWGPGADAGECNVDALLVPQSYGNKVKALLTGLPLTDAELTSLRDDPDSLATLIDGWLETVEADGALERFFMTALQQTGGNNESFFELFNRNNTATGFYQNPRSADADQMLNQNFSESMARTAIELTRQGRPFTEIITTDTFMMTTAMMSFLAFTDDEVVEDDGGRIIRTSGNTFDSITLVKNPGDAPPPEEAMDPSSPNFATFYHPRIASQLDGIPACNGPIPNTITIDTRSPFVDGEWRANGATGPFFMFSAVVLGRMHQIRKHNVNGCNSNASNVPPLLDRGDFSDWRMVRVRKPSGVEAPDAFYRAETLRAKDELVVHTPRVGFFSNPGFLSTWLTNEDNSARVSINQTLIVALNASFDGVAVSNFEPDIDEEHSNGECYGCHQTLDPMRDYFRSSYTNFYGEQLDPERQALQADFVFGGVDESGSGIEALANTLAAHPYFPYAWAHKLCYWANSAACAEGDELDRVVTAFVDSGHDFRVLVRELFSSPLITGSECVSGVDAGTTATIARRSTFCNGLSQRLGMDDLCGVRTHFRDADNLQNDIRDAVSSVPDDNFSRSEIAPVVIAETGLFARANREAACSILGQDGYADALGTLERADAVDVLVQSVMGLPAADTRHAAVKQVLEDHIDEVIATGETEEIALQSALALACMSPGAAGVGF